MPQAVVHVLFAIIVLDLFRDYIVKDKKKIPLSFIFIGGIAGLLPDIDIPVFWILKYAFGSEVPWFHRLITHTLLFAGIFLFIAIVFFIAKKQKQGILFSIITFGVLFHILLDYMFMGTIMPWYPLSDYATGLRLISNLKVPALAEGIEALVFLAWLYHEEKRHKISDFI